MLTPTSGLCVDVRVWQTAAVAVAVDVEGGCSTPLAVRECTFVLLIVVEMRTRITVSSVVLLPFAIALMMPQDAGPLVYLTIHASCQWVVEYRIGICSLVVITACPAVPAQLPMHSLEQENDSNSNHLWLCVEDSNKLSDMSTAFFQEKTRPMVSVWR